MATAVLLGGYAAAHDPIGTKVTWDREIAPIVQARCVSCHSEGGKGPPLMTYEEARPWAKAIKEEVLTRRMPKWAAARGYGDFLNDRSLSPFEIALIVAWVDGGAPKTLPRLSPRVKVLPPPAEFSAPEVRTASVPCSAKVLPPGTLLGIRPELAAGASVRVVVGNPTNGPEALLWIRDFDPEFADTYWLRVPITVGRAYRNLTTSTGSCTLDLLYSAAP